MLPVTTATPHRLSPVPSAAPVGNAPRSTALLPPGWPLTATLAGFPIWWVLGISNFIGHLAALVMIVELVRMRKVRVPKTIGVWFLFLIWVAAGVLVLQVAAPYAVPSTSSGRYFTFAYRFGWYLSGTVALIYIGNMRETLSSARIVRAAAALFITIVGGGWLGVLAPHISIQSILELLLPGSVANNEFVNFLIHPQIVQDYARAVAEYPRPSAPFGYANIWGLNFACFLPFFLLAWFGPDAGWRRKLGPIILLFALVPAVLSLNRGMWLAVIAMAVVVGVRSAVRGHFRALAALAAGMMLALALVVVTPLGSLVLDRLQNPQSAQTRSNVADTTVASVLEGSPVIGFGSTRDPANAFYSVAGGDSPNCPECGPPALGTQGHLWLVLYSQGIIGLTLFLWFHGVWLVRGLRLASGVATAASCLLIAQAVTLLIYDSLGIATFAALMAIGLIWREHDRESSGGLESTNSETNTLQDYSHLLRESAAVIILFAVVGMMLGGVVGVLTGRDYIGTVSLYLPEEPENIDPRSVNLDTLAFLARGGVVTDSLRRAVDESPRFQDVVISADPNSRILNFRYTANNASNALKGAAVAGESMLAVRRELLQTERQEAVSQFGAQYSASLRAIETVDQKIVALGGTPGASKATPRTQLLVSQRSDLLVRAGRSAGQGARASAAPIDPGRVVRPAAVSTSYDRIVVFMSSGLLLGLLIGIAIARLRSVRGTRIGSIANLESAVILPVIAHLPVGALSSSGRLNAGYETAWTSTVNAVLVHTPVTVVSASSDPESLRVLLTLNSELTGISSLAAPDSAWTSLTPSCEERAVIIANSRLRIGSLRRYVAGQHNVGLLAVGLVLVDSERKTRFHLAPWVPYDTIKSERS